MFECKKCGNKQFKLEKKGTQTALRCADPNCNFWQKWLGKEELAKYRRLLAENGSGDESCGICSKKITVFIGEKNNGDTGYQIVPKYCPICGRKLAGL